MTTPGGNISAFEIEEPTAARSANLPPPPVVDTAPKMSTNLIMSAVLVVVSLLFGQTLLLARVAWATIPTTPFSDVPRGESKPRNHRSHFSTDTEDFDTEGEDDVDNSSCVEGGLQFKSTTSSKFKKRFIAHRAGFATLWLEHSKSGGSGEAYFEFPIEAMMERQVSEHKDFMYSHKDLVNDHDQKKKQDQDEISQNHQGPYFLSAGAIYARGRAAHMDATDEDPPVLSLWFADNDTKIQVRSERLDIRMISKEYENLMNDRGRSTLLASAAIVGNRTDAGCNRTHVFVPASLFINHGFFVYEGSGELVETSVRAFPRNIDVTLKIGDDKIRFCLFLLPPDPMVPRVADDRVGYFDVSFTALGDYRNEKWPDMHPDQLIYPKIRLIQRQRIERLQGNKNLPVYVDHTVPLAFRNATKIGVSRWNAAFEAIGMGPVLHVLAPGDPGFPEDYDVADVRFNTISWAAGDDMDAPFAIGQSVSDPRTGEILKANIVFSLGWLAAWLGEALLFHAHLPSHPMPRSHTVQGEFEIARLLQADFQQRQVLSGNEASFMTLGGSALDSADVRQSAQSLRVVNMSHLTPAMCTQQGRALRHRHVHEDSMCRAMLDDTPSLWYMKSDRTEEEIADFLQDGIADVAAHEFGHVLGLRHNFQGSLSIKFEQLQDESHIKVHGLSSSVMDYVASNIVSKKAPSKAADKQAPFFTPVIGSYDKWAIKYGYTPIEDEQCCVKPAKLDEIASEYDNSGQTFSFGTDEDVSYNGRLGADPYTRPFDLTDNPVLWHLDRFDLASETQKEVLERAVQKGESFANVAAKQSSLLRTAFIAASNLAEFVGGIRVYRRHAESESDDSNATKPVELQDQLKALDGFLRFLTAPMGEMGLPSPHLQSKMVQRVDFYGMRPFDVMAKVNEAKSELLRSLLDSQRLRHIMLAGKLLGQEDLLRQILRKASEKVLGVPFEWFPGMNATMSVLSEVSLRHVQLEYLKQLEKLSRSQSPKLSIFAMVMEQPLEHGIAVIVQAEIIRLLMFIETVMPKVATKTEKDIISDLNVSNTGKAGEKEEADLEQIAFLRTAIKMLKGE